MKTREEVEDKMLSIYIELDEIAKNNEGKILTQEQANAVNQLAGQAQALEWVIGK